MFLTFLEWVLTIVIGRINKRSCVFQFDIMKLTDVDIAALIAGIIALAFNYYLGLLTVLFGILAIVFGSIAIEKGDPKNYGSIGRILGIIAIVIVVITFFAAALSYLYVSGMT